MESQIICSHVLGRIRQCYEEDICTNHDFMRDLAAAVESMFQIVRSSGIEEIKIDSAVGLAKEKLQATRVNKFDLRGMCFKSALLEILYASVLPEFQHLMPQHHDYFRPLLLDKLSFLQQEHYKGFANLDENEVDNLWKFRNYLKVLQSVLPTEGNIQLSVEIAARAAEGTHRKWEGQGTQHKYYTTGSRKTAATERRVKICREEGQLKKKYRRRGSVVYCCSEETKQEFDAWNARIDFKNLLEIQLTTLFGKDSFFLDPTYREILFQSLPILYSYVKDKPPSFVGGTEKDVYGLGSNRSDSRGQLFEYDQTVAFREVQDESSGRLVSTEEALGLDESDNMHLKGKYRSDQSVADARDYTTVASSFENGDSPRDMDANATLLQAPARQSAGVRTTDGESANQESTLAASESNIHSVHKISEVMKPQAESSQGCKKQNEDLPGGENRLSEQRISEKLNKGDENDRIDLATEVAKLALQAETFEKQDLKRICFSIALLLMYSRLPQHEAALQAIQYDQPKLLECYPEFYSLTDRGSGGDQLELGRLVVFRNTLRICLEIMPAENNKWLILNIITRLTEGRGREYITGSGASEATKRRVLIYEREGNVKTQTRQRAAELARYNAPPNDVPFTTARTVSDGDNATGWMQSGSNYSAAYSAVSAAAGYPPLRFENYFAAPNHQDQLPLGYSMATASSTSLSAVGVAATAAGGFGSGASLNQYVRFPSATESTQAQYQSMSPSDSGFFSGYPTRTQDDKSHYITENLGGLVDLANLASPAAGGATFASSSLNPFGNAQHQYFPSIVPSLPSEVNFGAETSMPVGIAGVGGIGGIGSGGALEYGRQVPISSSPRPSSARLSTSRVGAQRSKLQHLVDVLEVVSPKWGKIAIGSALSQLQLLLDDPAPTAPPSQHGSGHRCIAVMFNGINIDLELISGFISCFSYVFYKSATSAAGGEPDGGEPEFELLIGWEEGKVSIIRLSRMVVNASPFPPPPPPATAAAVMTTTAANSSMNVIPGVFTKANGFSHIDSAMKAIPKMPTIERAHASTTMASVSRTNDLSVAGETRTVSNAGDGGGADGGVAQQGRRGRISGVPVEIVFPTQGTMYIGTSLADLKLLLDSPSGAARGYQGQQAAMSPQGSGHRYISAIINGKRTELGLASGFSSNSNHVLYNSLGKTDLGELEADLHISWESDEVRSLEVSLVPITAQRPKVTITIILPGTQKPVHPRASFEVSGVQTVDESAAAAVPVPVLAPVPAPEVAPAVASAAASTFSYDEQNTTQHISAISLPISIQPINMSATVSDVNKPPTLTGAKKSPSARLIGADRMLPSSIEPTGNRVLNSSQPSSGANRAVISAAVSTQQEQEPTRAVATVKQEQQQLTSSSAIGSNRLTPPVNTEPPASHAVKKRVFSEMDRDVELEAGAMLLLMKHNVKQENAVPRAEVHA